MSSWAMRRVRIDSEQVHTISAEIHMTSRLSHRIEVWNMDQQTNDVVPMTPLAPPTINIKYNNNNKKQQQIA